MEREREREREGEEGNPKHKRACGRTCGARTHTYTSLVTVCRQPVLTVDFCPSARSEEHTSELQSR